MRKILIVLIGLLILHPGYSFAQTKPTDLLSLKYDDTKQNTLDLFLPESYNLQTPVIMLLHGGAWMMGGKEYTDKTAKDLRNRGYIVANVDYRYVSPTVNYKNLLSDLDKAQTLLKAKSREYHFAGQGYNLAGISAGAHLALLYGYTGTSPFRSIIALCAPVRLDTQEAIDILKKNNLLNTVELLAGVTYDRNQKINTGFTKISPYAYVKAVPTLLFHGDQDTLVPDSQSKYLYKILKDKGIAAKFIPMAGKGHDCGMNDPESEKLVLNEMQNWLNKYN